jgi:hypothetical protein
MLMLSKLKQNYQSQQKKSFKELEYILQGKLITARLTCPSDFKGSWAIDKDIPNWQTNDCIYVLWFVLSEQESHVNKSIKADLLKAEITENRCEQVK